MDKNKSPYLEYDKDGNIVLDDTTVSIEYMLNEYLYGKPKKGNDNQTGDYIYEEKK